ncbi:MAG: hypothetical protein NTW13_02750 [Candidatus Omnitrophica bacterium]|nr:hypothetical protein [Candidatus Omnitrophota bacterium]
MTKAMLTFLILGLFSIPAFSENTLDYDATTQDWTYRAGSLTPAPQVSTAPVSTSVTSDTRLDYDATTQDWTYRAGSLTPPPQSNIQSEKYTSLPEGPISGQANLQSGGDQPQPSLDYKLKGYSIKKPAKIPVDSKDLNNEESPEVQ